MNRCACPWCTDYDNAQKTLCGCCGEPLGYVGDVTDINLCARCKTEQRAAIKPTTTEPKENLL